MSLLLLFANSPQNATVNSSGISASGVIGTVTVNANGTVSTTSVTATTTLGTVTAFGEAQRNYAPGDSLGGDTFARTGAATYYNKVGVLVSVATGVVRDDDYISGVGPYLLVEATRDQLVLQNDQPDGSQWNNLGTRITGILDPQGGTAGIRFTLPSGASAFHRQTFLTGQVTVTLPYVAAVWARKATVGGANFFRLTSNNTLAWATGTSTKFALTTSWQRFEAVVTLTDTSFNGMYVMAGNTDINGNPDATCAGDVEFAFLTLEQATYASTTIINSTSSGAVTRGYDNLSLTLPSTAPGTRYHKYIDLATSSVVEEVVPYSGSTIVLRGDVDGPRAYLSVKWSSGTRNLSYMQALGPARSSGNAGSITLGTITVSGNATVAVTSATATTALGTSILNATGTVAVTAVTATTALGTVTVNANSTISTTSVTATTALGTVTVTATANRTQTGVSATGVVGTATSFNVYPFTQLFDNYDDGVLDTARFAYSSSRAEGTFTESGGKFSISVLSGSSAQIAATLSSSIKYSLNNSFVSVQVDVSQFDRFVYLWTTTNTDTSVGGDIYGYSINLQNGALFASYASGSVSNQTSTTRDISFVFYNATSHSFWRIRGDAATPPMVYFETSPTGQVWTAFASQSAFFDVGALNFKLAAGIATRATNDTVYFDNLNIISASVASSGTSAASSIGTVTPSATATLTSTGVRATGRIGTSIVSSIIDISSYYDSFDDGIVDLTHFATSSLISAATESVVESGSALRIQWQPNISSGPQQPFYGSTSPSFNFVSGSIFFEVSQVSGVASIKFTDAIGLTNPFGWSFFNGGIQATSPTDNIGITYSPIDHRFLKLIHSQSVMQWQTSPDGMAWTRLLTSSFAFPLNNLRLDYSFWQTGVTGSLTEFVIEGVNFLNSTVTASGISAVGSIGDASVSLSPTVSVTGVSVSSTLTSILQYKIFTIYPAIQLFDNFNDNSFNQSLFVSQSATNAPVSESNNQLQFYNPSGSTFGATVRTVPQLAYSLVDSMVGVEVDLSATNIPSASITFKLSDPTHGGQGYELNANAGLLSTLVYTQTSGGGLLGTTTGSNPVITFDPTAMRWWRFREVLI
jgi:hypothetical protein